MHITIGIATRGRPAILAGVLRDLAGQSRAADRILVCHVSADDITGCETIPDVDFITAPAGLPRQPSEAFRLARQVATGGRPREAGAALVALQRRQWWLLPGQERALLALWDGGKEQELPASLGTLPEDISLRLSSPSAAAPQAHAELHGRSLIDGYRLWLFWQQGESLWLLRGALLGPPTPPPPALTGS